MAVLGASERPSIGRAVVESLELIGFPGDIYPINPKYETLLGRRCYPSIAYLPAGVDCLAFCVNHERVLEHMRPAAERGVGAVVVFDGGFAGSGREGRRLQNEIAADLPGSGYRLLRPQLHGRGEPARPQHGLRERAARSRHARRQCGPHLAERLDLSSASSRTAAASAGAT